MAKCKGARGTLRSGERIGANSSTIGRSKRREGLVNLSRSTVVLICNNFLTKDRACIFNLSAHWDLDEKLACKHVIISSCFVDRCHFCNRCK